jgi:hypothetical protein
MNAEEARADRQSQPNQADRIRQLRCVIIVTRCVTVRRGGLAELGWPWLANGKEEQMLLRFILSDIFPLGSASACYKPFWSMTSPALTQMICVKAASYALHMHAW